MPDEKQFYFTHTYRNGQNMTERGGADFVQRMKDRFPDGRISETPPVRRAAVAPAPTEGAEPSKPAPPPAPDAQALAGLAATTLQDGKFADLYLRGKRGDAEAAAAFDKLCADMNSPPAADTRDPVAFADAHLARKRAAKRADITAEIH